MGVERPHPGVVNLRGAEFDKPCVSSPGALALMHLKQPVLNARVIAGGDDAPDFHCKGVLIVAVAIVRGDAAGVPQGGCGLVLHGVLTPREDVAPQELTFSPPREDVAPQELTFSQGLIKLGNQDLGSS